METHIYFFSPEDVFKLADEEFSASWLSYLIKQNQRAIEEINFIFVTDAYLLQMNQKHLDHDFYTDILTFAYEENPIQADIYISVERVMDNAKQLLAEFQDELDRVMAHGILHILGYNDHEEKDKTLMRKQEDMALNLRSFIKKA